MINSRYLFVGLMLAAGTARAELFVTGAEPRADLSDERWEAADLEVHTHLLVRGVRGDAAGGLVELPSAELRALSRSLREQFIGVFSSRTYLAETFPAEDIYYSVGAPRRVAPTGRVLEVEVVFRGELAVTFGVLRAGDLSVLYPSRRRPDGRPERLFDFLDHRLRLKVEADILRRCRQALRE